MKKTKWLWLGFAVSALASAVIQIVSALTALEPGEFYFKINSPLPTLAVLLALLSAAMGSLAAWRTDRNSLAASPFPKGSTFSPVVLGFLVAAIAIPLVNHTKTNPDIARTATVFLAVSVLYSLLVGFSKCRKHAGLMTLLGFAPVIACVALITYYYFDVSVEMNAPLKTALQTALLFAVLCYTGELRYLLDRPMPRLYLALSAWTVSIGALSALSLPIAFFAGKIDRLDYAAGGILVFGIVMTVGTRMYTLITGSPNKPLSPTEETEELSPKAQEEAADAEEETVAPDPKDDTTIE